MRLLRIISRILVGCVFIFSGFVKGIDPQGFAIKLSEYFVSFGLPEWEGLALVLAVMVCTAELLIGISLFIGLRMKVTAWAAMIFMSFFTLLTLYIALYNPVSDCGCFGDAIILSNWTTFYKNIVLISLTLFIFYQRKLYVPVFNSLLEWSTVAFYGLIGIVLFVYCIRHLPIIDFRPYHVGADIPAGMVKPEGTPNDQFRTLFYYKKNGIVKEFSNDNYPWQDSTWSWVRTKQILIKKGYTPPIHDFSILTETGNDITDSVLQNKAYTFLLVAEDLNNASKLKLKDASSLANEAYKSGLNFYCLTATPMDNALTFKNNNKLSYPMCSTDRTTLKTMIRSNPGLILIRDGIVLGKWHYNDFPGIEFLKKNMLAQQLNQLRQHSTMWMNLMFMALFFLSAFGILLLRYQHENK